MNTYLSRINLPTVDSTNTFVREMLAEESSGSVVSASSLPGFTLVVADNQTAGRGQKGNTWETEKGKNLIFSLLCHPDMVKASEQFVLLQCRAIAVRDALAKVADGVKVKWPNDIYWDDLKISGTLSECEINSSGVKSCIIGSGINVNQREFVSDAPNPVSLSQIMRRTVPLKKVFEAVLAKFEHYLAIVNAGEYAKLKEEYMGVLYRRYGSYGYIDGDGEFYARIEDVGQNGHIMLRRDDGMLSEYEFKEVKFKLKQR